MLYSVCKPRPVVRLTSSRELFQTCAMVSGLIWWRNRSFNYAPRVQLCIRTPHPRRKKGHLQQEKFSREQVGEKYATNLQISEDRTCSTWTKSVMPLIGTSTSKYCTEFRNLSLSLCSLRTSECFNTWAVVSDLTCSPKSRILLKQALDYNSRT